jgi:acyl-CoA thioester hydrolase
LENNFKFFTPIQVRYSETDPQGHVFFGHYFNYYDIALVEYLSAVGYSYNDFLNDGVDFFYVQAECRFMGEARYSETLHVHVRAGNVGNTSFTIEFSVFEQESARPIAAGSIVGVTVKKGTSEKVSVPERFRKAVDDFENVNG